MLFRSTSGARALKSRVVLKDAPADTPVHYDSKLDKFDQRRAIFARQYSRKPTDLPGVLNAGKMFLCMSSGGSLLFIGVSLWR